MAAEHINAWGAETRERYGARMKFRKGDRVQLSEKGRGAHLVRNSNLNRLGTVAADPRTADLVRVAWDGTKSVQSYFAGFIEHVPIVEIEIPAELENDTERN